MDMIGTPTLAEPPMRTVGRGVPPASAAPSAERAHDRLEPAEAAALLATELRRSLGNSPQLDKALGQLLSLLA